MTLNLFQVRLVDYQFTRGGSAFPCLAHPGVRSVVHGCSCTAKGNFDIEVVTYPFSVQKVAKFQAVGPRSLRDKIGRCLNQQKIQTGTEHPFKSP